jgi:hypothetical protein
VGVPSAQQLLQVAKALPADVRMGTQVRAGTHGAIEHPRGDLQTVSGVVFMQPAPERTTTIGMRRLSVYDEFPIMQRMPLVADSSARSLLGIAITSCGTASAVTKVSMARPPASELTTFALPRCWS